MNPDFKFQMKRSMTDREPETVNKKAKTANMDAPPHWLHIDAYLGKDAKLPHKDLRGDGTVAAGFTGERLDDLLIQSIYEYACMGGYTAAIHLAILVSFTIHKMLSPESFTFSQLVTAIESLDDLWKDMTVGDLKACNQRCLSKLIDLDKKLRDFDDEGSDFRWYEDYFSPDGDAKALVKDLSVTFLGKESRLPNIFPPVYSCYDHGNHLGNDKLASLLVYAVRKYMHKKAYIGGAC